MPKKRGNEMRRNDEKEKSKKERKEKQRKGKERKKQFVGKKRERKGKEKRKGKGKREDFPELRRLKLNGPSTKVGTRSAIYVWTPKTWSFYKLRKVGIFILGLLLV